MITGGTYETPIDLLKHGQEDYYVKIADRHNNRIRSRFVCVWHSDDLSDPNPILLHSSNLRYWSDDAGNEYEDLQYSEKLEQRIFKIA